MSRSSESVKRWRERTKLKIIDSMGGECCLCGYNKCFAAMDMHHKDPSMKEIGFGKIIANPKAWSKIVEELRKCVLLCSNCHREVHQGFSEVPINAPSFDEKYVDAHNDLESFVGAELMDECPICGKQKPLIFKVCSRKCAAMKSRSVDWDNVDLLKMKSEGKSNTEIGDMLGVSNAAVWKRFKKINVNNSSIV